MNLTLKNIPEGVCKTLKQSAAKHGRSLNAEAIRVLAEAAEEERRRDFIASSREDLNRFRASLPKLSSSVPLIRQDRRSH